MTREEWLNSLKVGDRVAVENASSNEEYHFFYTIKRITDKLIILDAYVNRIEVVFDKKDGNECHGSYFKLRRLVPVAKRIEEANELYYLKNRLSELFKRLHDKKEVILEESKQTIMDAVVKFSTLLQDLDK